MHTHSLTHTLSHIAHTLTQVPPTRHPPPPPSRSNTHHYTELSRTIGAVQKKMATEESRKTRETKPPSWFGHAMEKVSWSEIEVLKDVASSELCEEELRILAG